MRYLLLLAALVAASAQAQTSGNCATPSAKQTTYAYSGAVMAVTPGTPGETIPSYVNGQITLCVPLPPNATNYEVGDAISWSFDGDPFLASDFYAQYMTPGVGQYSSNNSQDASFVFSTNAAGEIVAWTVNVSTGFYLSNFIQETLTLSMAGDKYTYLNGPDCDIVGCAPSVASNSKPGTWANNTDLQTRLTAQIAGTTYYIVNSLAAHAQTAVWEARAKALGWK